LALLEPRTDSMPNLQQRASLAVQRSFYKAFYNWGSFVGRRPILVILISTILALAASVSSTARSAVIVPQPSCSGARG
jgi:hypothetical protein